MPTINKACQLSKRTFEILFHYFVLFVRVLLQSGGACCQAVVARANGVAAGAMISSCVGFHNPLLPQYWAVKASFNASLAAGILNSQRGSDGLREARLDQFTSLRGQSR